MHGQQSASAFRNTAHGATTNTSPTAGRVLSDGSMPPQPDSSQQHQGSLVERMSVGGCAPPYLDPPRPGGLEEDLLGLDGCSEAKRKKGAGVAGKSIEEELCRICGDRASGYHYNALSCEGCKGFFRRSITKTATYQCKYGGNCEMDMWMRRKCQACRLRRCREVGMKEECLLSEDQCKARDARRKSKQRPSVKKEAASPDSNGSIESSASVASSSSCLLPPDCGSSKPPQPELSSRGPPSEPSQSAWSPPGDSSEDNPLQYMPRVHQDTLGMLMILQKNFEFPDEKKVEEAMMQVSEQRGGHVQEVSANSFLQSMASMTVLITHLIVEFAKCLPGFTELDMDDQIILLKAASSEVMAIRAARCYDLDTKAIVFANGQPCSLQNMLDTGLGEYARLVYKFCHDMAVMVTDNAEYALITAIVIFSDRPGLKDKSRVEQLQTPFVDCLQSYESAKRRRGGSQVAKFLTRLSDLRTIALEHSKLLQDVGSTLPTLISETYILPPEAS